MATSNVTGFKAYNNTAALSAYRRVTVSSIGLYAYAGNTVVGDGVLQEDTSTDDPIKTIRLFCAPGTYQLSITGAPITAGDTVYAAANGQGSSTGTVILGKIAFDNGGITENGAVAEIIPMKGTLA